MRSVHPVRRLTAALLLLALLSGCAAAPAAPEIAAVTPRPLPAAEGLRIAVASDLHLNPASRPSAEPTPAEFSSELIDALLWDAQRQGAELLLLTGDICNGARAAYHEALADKLARAEAAGLSVYVLPGNHDLGQFTQTDFARIYAPYGFAEAESRDEGSLSYCVVRDGLMLLMLDTGGYPAAAHDLPGAEREDGAFLSESTLRWVKARLDEAQERGLRVICAGHYNLLTAVSRDPANAGYYVRGGEALAALLREAGALVYLSGHIHTRAVYQEDGLRELVTEYLLAYPNGYSVLDLSERQLRYTPRRVDVDAWAAESGQTEPLLLNFAASQQDALRRSAALTVESMATRNGVDAAQQAEAAAFFYAALDAYWLGTLASRREALEAMPGYAAFFRCAEGYAYSWWLRDLFDTATSALSGFTVLF